MNPSPDIKAFLLGGAVMVFPFVVMTFGMHYPIQTFTTVSIIAIALVLRRQG